MYYVEFLRVLRALRGLGYVLAAFILLTVATRPWSHNDMHSTLPQPAAGVTPTETKAADGSTIRTYVDTKGRDIRIKEDPAGVYSIRITDHSGKHAGRGDATLKLGNVEVHAGNRNGGKTRVTEITDDPHVPVAILLLIASGVAALLGSIFGLALSRENDGHLELAWTKPVSRERYALTVMAVDAGAILAAGVATLLTIVILFIIEGLLQYVTPRSGTWAALAFGIVFPLSLYAIIVAATSSLRRGGQVLALFLPIALLLPLLSAVQWMSIGTVARLLNTINPVAYFYGFVSGSTFGMLPALTAYQILAPALLGAIFVAVSLAQWRRLEA